MIVLKIGGTELSRPAFLTALGDWLLAADTPTIIVHGGGHLISDLQNRLQLPTQKVDGIRLTDAASLQITEMALSGGANKLVVRALVNAGVRAIGLSGIDFGLLRCHKKPHESVDFGFVGTIDTVNAGPLHALLDAGFTPVVSPVSLGHDGHAYNVNADEAAAALGSALAAERLDFVSNVPGVLVDGAVIPYLTPAAVEALIAAGVITGGMIPKVRSALAAVNAGVRQVRIVNLDGLSGGGTILAATQPGDQDV